MVIGQDANFYMIQGHGTAVSSGKTRHGRKILYFYLCQCHTSKKSCDALMDHSIDNPIGKDSVIQLTPALTFFKGPSEIYC